MFTLGIKAEDVKPLTSLIEGSEPAELEVNNTGFVENGEETDVLLAVGNSGAESDVGVLVVTVLKLESKLVMVVVVAEVGTRLLLVPKSVNDAMVLVASDVVVVAVASMASIS